MEAVLPKCHTSPFFADLFSASCWSHEDWEAEGTHVRRLVQRQGKNGVLSTKAVLYGREAAKLLIKHLYATTLEEGQDAT